MSMAAEGTTAGIGSAGAGAATVAAMVSVFCDVNKMSYKTCLTIIHYI